MFDLGIRSPSLHMQKIGAKMVKWAYEAMNDARINPYLREKRRSYYDELAFEIMADDMIVVPLVYYEEENICYDEFGMPVFNLYDYIRPGEYRLFKEQKEDVVLISQIEGVLVSLTYIHEGGYYDD